MEKRSDGGNSRERSSGPKGKEGPSPVGGWLGPNGNFGGRGLAGRGSTRSSQLHTPRSLSIEPLVDGPGVPRLQSLTVSERVASVSSSFFDRSNKATPVKRPDNGGVLCSRKLQLLVNHFPVRFNPETVIRHYIVDVKLETPRKRGHTAKLQKSTLAMIRNKLFTDNPRRFPLDMTAYDGERNIFSAVTLPTEKIQVKFAEAEDMTSQTYIFSLKLLSELKLCKLKDYLQGNLFSIPRDILQGMDVVMKENPTMHMISIGRNFHPIDASPEDDLGFGITASKGFQQSLKPSAQGLALCLDYNVLAFIQPLPVLDFLQKHIRGFNIKEFRKFRKDVENVIKGLQVRVTHRLTKQKYRIKGLTWDDTEDVTFNAEDPDGSGPPRRISIVDFYRQKYHKDIEHKHIPCLDLGKNNRMNYVPMEFCILVEGQTYPIARLGKEAAEKLKVKSLVNPNTRLRTIKSMVESDNGPCSGNVIQNFGIQVSKEMKSVVGRLIGPPDLKLGASLSGGFTKVVMDRETLRWNLDGKRLVEGKSIERWAIIDFSASESSTRKRLNPSQFIVNLIDRCRSLGMLVEEPLFYKPSSMLELANCEILQELLINVSAQAYKTSKGQLQIILCVMSKKHSGYKYLKFLSETRLGVVTQCCLSTHAIRNKENEQYLANLALKINAKLGGSNVEFNDRLPYFHGEDRFMFVGADVNHPGPKNQSSPSIAAVVATINWPAANHYAARVCAQDHRTEKILNFGNMCLELVETFTRLNYAKPNKIVIFRDGVSEGQFDMVLNEELVDLKRVLNSRNYTPTITVIVAQKGHQMRLFPEGWRDGSSTGNVHPGTVVDTGIVHPFEFDFYLCSHYGSLGTSRPTHYHVLRDEHGFTSDQVQKLIYSLCFTFARSTKPVALVPPVYYADLAAYRGRLYYEAVAERKSPPSASSSSLKFPSLSSASSWDEGFYKLHPNLQNVMFFV